MNAQFLEDLSKITAVMSNEVEMYKKNKHELTRIVLEKDLTADEKLDSLEDTILRFRVTVPENLGVGSSVKEKDLGEIDFSRLGNVNLDDLTKIGEIMQSVAQPSRIHGELLESIGGVLRNVDSSEVKIKLIRRLLV